MAPDLSLLRNLGILFNLKNTFGGIIVKSILSLWSADKHHRLCNLFYPLWLAAMLIGFYLTRKIGLDVSFLVWGFVLLFLFIIRPHSIIYRTAVDDGSVARKGMTLAVIVCLILICTYPMSVFPHWNGEDPAHRNQYELIAESMLNVHLYFDYGEEYSLEHLENPYDPVERAESGAQFKWDHAYYNGHYYMYFGVVPVLVLFLPYLAITGTALTTYHATQIFAAFIICGLFALFSLLSKLFFKKLPYAVYLSLSAAFSVMSVWFSIAEPQLYCTAITAGIAFQIWSIYFFVRAVWAETAENKQILFAAIGALLGALVFGCRPPIALANLIVLPMLVVFLRQRRFTPALLGKLILAASPYLLVGISLMTYNYLRFDNPFEFGQAYQLTVADQSQYNSMSFSPDVLAHAVIGAAQMLSDIHLITFDFPYLVHCGAFVNFPVLLLLLLLFTKQLRTRIKQTHFGGVILGIAASVVIISLTDSAWTPYILERYRMDIYFLLAIACFAVIGFWYAGIPSEKLTGMNTLLVLCSSFTLICSALFTLRAITTNYPETVQQIGIIVRDLLFF